MRELDRSAPMAISRNNHIYGLVRAFVDHVGPPLRTELDRIARNVWEAEAARRGRQDRPLIAGKPIARAAAVRSTTA
jgi:hypothetical protein